MLKHYYSVSKERFKMREQLKLLTTNYSRAQGDTGRDEWSRREQPD